jgi:hypothetical protein
VVKTFFDHGLFSKTRFRGKNVLFLDKNCINILIFSQSPIFDKKMFGPLFSDSVYFSESKTTFGMFGIITFAVDS